MKLATIKDSTRDGKLVVVSKDLTRCSEVGHIARNLQAALDDWAHAGPRLARVAEGIETGSQPTMRFHEHDAAAPLPRAYGRMHGWGQGLVQARSSGFAGARDGLALPAGIGGFVVESGLAAILNDSPGREETRDGSGAIILLMLYADLAPAPGGPGDPSTATSFSPVAVTPDELGEAWAGGRSSLPFRRMLNNESVAPAAGSTEAPDLIRLAASATGSRSATAGIVVSAVSATSESLMAKAGDLIRIEMKDGAGHSIFGAIEHRIAAGDQATTTS